MTLSWTLLLEESIQVTLDDFFVLELYDWPVHFVSQLHVFFHSQTLLLLFWIKADFGLTFELNCVALCRRCHHVPRPITRDWRFGLGHWRFRECDWVKFLAVTVACWTEDWVLQVRTLTSNLRGTILWHLIVSRVVRFFHSSRWPAAIDNWSIKPLLFRTCRWHWLFRCKGESWGHSFILAELGSESTGHSIPESLVRLHLQTLFLFDCVISLYIFLKEHLVILYFLPIVRLAQLCLFDNPIIWIIIFGGIELLKTLRFQFFAAFFDHLFQHFFFLTYLNLKEVLLCWHVDAVTTLSFLLVIKVHPAFKRRHGQRLSFGISMLLTLWFIGADVPFG